MEESTGPHLRLWLSEETATRLAPDGDTSTLCRVLELDSASSNLDLELEILLAMLMSPVQFDFPSHHELTSAIRIRSAIVQAARRTTLAFATTEAERPADYWYYDEDRGFLLQPAKPLIAALERATNPGDSNTLYTFSCRRATEYLVLLGLAQEARVSNPQLFEQLHRQAETRALKGGEFERTFVRTIGSTSQAFPVRFFVPGDRTWFRNIDPVSADVTGYEGSWTIYLGNGQFADFWRPGRVFTLESKLACIYHWRNSTYYDSHGDLQIDEAKVEALTESACQTPGAIEPILIETLRLQSPLGTTGGGCIESHREHPCLVHPKTTDVVLPDVPHQTCRCSRASTGDIR
ncbi:MAG: hypothetical protein JSS49_02880 [Planctomycetes bacterium]|nr:hypothetical protein [Planctomycetota bacterium]